MLVNDCRADPEPFLQYVVRVEDAGRLWPLLKASLRTNDRKWATLPSILLVGLCRINTDNYCTKLNHRLEFNAFMFDVYVASETATVEGT